MTSLSVRLHASPNPGAPTGATATAPPRCPTCGDVLGIYEPLLVRSGGSLRQTSFAAEPDLLGGAAAVYHRDCAPPDAPRA